MKDVAIVLILAACLVCCCQTCRPGRPYWLRPDAEPFRIYEFKRAPIQVVDTDGAQHTVLERDFGFRDSEPVRTAEGHELVFLRRGGCEQFVHVRPCRKCFDAAFAEKMAELERQTEEKERKEQAR